jgi:hypothetical protein
VAVASELRALLEAQRAHFANDDHIREEVAMWADSTPQERLAELAGMCRDSEFFWSQIDDDALARMHALRELPADTIAVLERIRKASR